MKKTTIKPSSRMSESPCHFIDGQWRKNLHHGKSFENRNPATGELINVYPEAAHEDVEAAVQAAAKAFEMWRKVPVAKRGEILLRSMHLLEEHKEEWAKDMTREMGKVIQETRGDIQEAIDTSF